MTKIAMIGSGTWGIALANMLVSTGKEVMVWSAIDSEIDKLQATNTHDKLPNVKLSTALKYTKDIAEAMSYSDVIVLAVPSLYVRKTAKLIKPYVKDNQVIVDVAKGLEGETDYTMTEVIADEIGNSTIKLVALSGPTHAEEVAIGLPTTIVSACKCEKTAKYIQEVFSSSYMRVYTNTDVKGIELCGAVKNVIALSAGISTGLGYGDNAKAAIITRGMAEITRLGTAMGCMPRTYESLAGIGDLVVTCMSKHSRNNKAGMLLGQGYTVEEAVEKVGMVVEGLNALPAIIELAKRKNVSMPICTLVHKIVKKELQASQALEFLMNRDNIPEIM